MGKLFFFAEDIFVKRIDHRIGKRISKKKTNPKSKNAHIPEYKSYNNAD